MISAGKSFDELTIPENVEIVGLGEATHGNVEFQELKLEVFKKLVEDYGYSAFALEADFGDCLAANEYVQGGDGDAREIVNHMSFTIYHTKQMADTLDWMRDYNKSASEDKRLRFYGFDMQNPEVTVPYLTDYMDENGIKAEAEELNKLANTENHGDIDTEKVKKELDEIRAEIENQVGEDFDLNTEYALQATVTISQCMGYWQQEYANILNFRDQCMAENVTWILEQEKKIGSGKIMLGAHDGHISKKGHSMMQETIMGRELAEKYGEKYYSLGTDFFKGKVNIKVTRDDGYSRNDFFLTSADPMAYQAKYFDDNRYCIDFTTLSETEQKTVYDMVHSDMTMGTVGEGFTWLNYFIHGAYRIDMVPADLYDGMIFYYKVNPIVPEY